MSLGRFAPSPTGALHLGNMRTFLVTWLHARENGIEMLMRMEDLNIVRLKEGAIEQIYSDFQWLGLDWDKGAGLVKGEWDQVESASARGYYQNQCLEVYQKEFDRLKEVGAIYPCSCSRKDIQMAQSAPHRENELYYPGTCRGRHTNEEAAALAKGHPPSWRFVVDDTETVFEDGFYGHQKSRVSEWSGDFVISRTREEIAYQLAVVVDDERQGVNWVIRGEDLLMSTHRQILLQKALGYRTLNYLHLPLLIGPDGKRLAKRHGDWKISTLREQGRGVEEVLGLLAWTLGQIDWGESLSLKELHRCFDWEKIPKDPFVIDEKTRHLYNL